jgi:uncharacterized protein YjbI with pentapeptide repeats
VLILILLIAADRYLIRTVFRYAVWRKTDLSHTTFVSQSPPRFFPPNLEGYNLLGANLKGMRTWRGESFRYSILIDVDMSDTRATEANFALANMQNSKFNNSHLTFCNFRNATMRGIDLSGATLLECFLDGADLRGAKLKNTKFIKSTYDYNTLWPKNFNIKQHDLILNQH